MDFQQWRSNHDKQSDQSTDSAALPLFAPEHNKNSIIITTATSRAMSAFAESTTPNIFPWLGGYFSFAQWQELELQALIYKYMMAGASVPLELILTLKINLLNAYPYYHHSQQYRNLQPAMLQSGCWGRHAVDPEPGRCRRTDGKKWRCSRDVIAGQKYCERHVHRGRNRSRKLVEVSKPIPGSDLKAEALPPPLAMTKDSLSMESKTSPALAILPLYERPPDDKTLSGYLGSLCSNLMAKNLQREKPEGQVLRRFFDDWPRSEQESTINSSNTSIAASSTNLSISIPGNHRLSDFSLKLSTGNGSSSGCDKIGEGRGLVQTGNWSVAWGNHGEASMGGPLAEVLRSSSVSTPSPTSVLCKPNGSVSETSNTSN